MNKTFKITEVQAVALRDLVESYKRLLQVTEETDAFQDIMRQARIVDCEQALVFLKRLK